MAVTRALFLVSQIVYCFSIGLNAIPGGKIKESFTPDQLSFLALGVAKASYLPTDRFAQNGSIMENPKPNSNDFLKCPKDRPEKDAGLCYKPCKKRSSWAFANGVGSVCWGCPTSHPVEHAALCYRKCPSAKPKGRLFMCFDDCPAGYKNLGLICFRSGHLHNANNANCPWYDICGLIFKRGCSTCPAGYKNDGCTCRRNPHIISRPRHNRGIGVLMKSYRRGAGVLPTLFRYDPTNERETCQLDGWVGQAYDRGDVEVVKLTNDQQKLVVFGFRGTEVDSIRDWFHKFKFSADEFWLNNTRLTVHQGFKERYLKLKYL